MDKIRLIQLDFSFSVPICFLQSEEMIYFVKGALETVLSKCTHYYNDGSTSPLYEKQRKEYTSESIKMGTQGLRGRCLITCIPR